MTKYDPAVIQEFADRLYLRAATIVIFYTFIGIVVGGIGGFLAGAYWKGYDPRLIAVLGLLLMGLFGYAYGRERSFRLRLEAQTALCQVRIEENTRKAASSSERASDAPPSA